MMKATTYALFSGQIFKRLRPLLVAVPLWLAPPLVHSQVLCNMVSVPESVQVNAGESFQVTIQIEVPPAGAVTVADVYMQFNPAVINVSAIALNPLSPLSFVVQTSINNTDGLLNFVAFGFNAATESFNFITLDILAINDGYTLLEHITEGFPVSQLAYAGEDVTGQLMPAYITVGELESDCLGVPGGNAQTDACGVCYAQGAANPAWNTTCADCLGVPNGDAAIDECDECYAGGINNPDWNSTCVVTSALFSPLASAAGEIVVWPNPAKNTLNVGVRLQKGSGVVLQLIDAGGRQVAVAGSSYVAPEITQRFNLDVAALSSGLYLLRATTNSDVLVQKILIN